MGSSQSLTCAETEQLEDSVHLTKELGEKKDTSVRGQVLAPKRQTELFVLPFLK